MDAAQTAADALAYYRELTAALAPRVTPDGIPPETPYQTWRRLMGSFRETDDTACRALADAMRTILEAKRDGLLAAATAAFDALKTEAAR